MRDREGSEDAVDEVFATLAAEADGVTVILHCFSAGPTGPARPPSAAGTAPSPATSPTRSRTRCARRRGSSPSERILAETDSPFLAPQPVRGKPNQPANVVATAERLAEVRGIGLRAARAQDRGQCRPGLWLVAGGRGRDSAASARTSSPTRTCWTRSSATPPLEPADVVLEVGGGGGRSASGWRRRSPPAPGRARPAAAPELELSREDAGNVNLVWGDAMRIDLGALHPPPTTLVANLPYSIATPLLLRTIAELPSVGGWPVMVQREIAERLRASPGGRDYGSPSVLVQLACEVDSAPHRRPGRVHPAATSGVGVAAAAAPRPGGARRRPGARPGRLRPPAQVAGALARARPSRASGADPPGARATSGVPTDARAETLTAADFARAAARRMGARDRLGDGAPPRSSTSASTSAAAATTASMRSAPCSTRLSSPTRSGLGVGEADEVHLPGGRGPEPRRGGPGRAPRGGLGLATAANRGREADAGRRRARWRQRRRGGGAAAGGGEVEGIRSIAAAVGADVPSQVAPALPWWRAPARSSSRCRPRASTRWSWSPRSPGSRRPRSMPRPTGSAPDGARRARRFRAGSSTTRPEGASPLDYSELLVNDLQEAALSLRPEIAPVLEALADAGRRARAGHRLGADRGRAVPRPKVATAAAESLPAASPA